MALSKEKTSASRIIGLQFSILSPEEIMNNCYRIAQRALDIYKINLQSISKHEYDLKSKCSIVYPDNYCILGCFIDKKLVGFADYPTLGPTHAELDGKRIMKLFKNIKSFYPKNGKETRKAIYNSYKNKGPNFISLKTDHDY